MIAEPLVHASLVFILWPTCAALLWVNNYPPDGASGTFVALTLLILEFYHVNTSMTLY